MKMQIDCNITLWTGFVKKSGIKKGTKSVAKQLSNPCSCTQLPFAEILFWLKGNPAVRHRFPALTEL